MRWSYFAVALLTVSAFAQEIDCRFRFAVVFEDPGKTVYHGLSDREQKWFEKFKAGHPGICYVDPPHSFYTYAGPGQPPVLTDSLYPTVATEIAPFVIFVRASAMTYHGTKSVTRTQRSEAPVEGTATDPATGKTYDVTGTADVTTTVTQDVPYDVDYEELYAEIMQEQTGGIWRRLNDFDRRTLCPAVFGICVGNRHPYQEILQDGIEWLLKHPPNQLFDFQPDSPTAAH